MGGGGYNTISRKTFVGMWHINEFSFLVIAMGELAGEGDGNYILKL